MMVLDNIRSFFLQYVAPPPEDDSPEERGEPDRVQVATGALLLELAHADREFSDGERAHIHEVVAGHFGLRPETARELLALAEAERRQAVDLYQFTSLIAAHYDERSKLALVEMMWRLVYADGELARHEDYLMRKLGGLLGLRPEDMAAARRRARDAAE